MKRVGVLAIALAAGCFEDPGDLDPSTSTGPGGDSSTTGEPATTSGDAATSTDPDGSSTAVDPDSSGGGPVCGDMTIEGEETCEDGNDVDADGCTECRISLTPQWVEVFGSDFRGEAALGVSARPNLAVVAGTLEGASGDGDLWLELLDDEGNSEGRHLIGGAANGPDIAIDARLGLAGEVWAAGIIDDGGPAQAQIDVRHLSNSLEVIDWDIGAGLDNVPDRGVGIALTTDGAVVGGSFGAPLASDAWLGRYDDTGAVVEEYLCDCGAFGTVIDVAALPMKVRAIAIDGVAGELWAFDGPLDTLTWEVTFDADVALYGIAVALGGDTLVCGSQTGGNDRAVWLARYDASGDEVWTASTDLGDGDQACVGLHVAGETALVVGEIREDVNSARGLVARFDFATGDVLDSQELVIENSADTRVLAVDAVDGVPIVVGAYAVDALDDNAFAARLVP